MSQVAEAVIILQFYLHRGLFNLTFSVGITRASPWPGNQGANTWRMRMSEQGKMELKPPSAPPSKFLKMLSQNKIGYNHFIYLEKFVSCTFSCNIMFLGRGWFRTDLKLIKTLRNWYKTLWSRFFCCCKMTINWFTTQPSCLCQVKQKATKTYETFDYSHVRIKKLTKIICFI